MFSFLIKTKENRHKCTFLSVLSELEFGGYIPGPSGNVFSSQTSSQCDTIYHDCLLKLKRDRNRMLGALGVRTYALKCTVKPRESHVHHDVSSWLLNITWQDLVLIVNLNY